MKKLSALSVQQDTSKTGLSNQQLRIPGKR